MQRKHKQPPTPRQKPQQAPQREAATKREKLSDWLAKQEQAKYGTTAGREWQ